MPGVAPATGDWVSSVPDGIVGPAVAAGAATGETVGPPASMVGPPVETATGACAAGPRVAGTAAGESVGDSASAASTGEGVDCGGQKMVSGGIACFAWKEFVQCLESE